MGIISICKFLSKVSKNLTHTRSRHEDLAVINVIRLRTKDYITTLR